MALINGYLTFNGNCREAMRFYRRCLGGELTFQTIAGTPLSTKLPPNMQKAILHATLTKGEMILMGSDIVGRNGYVSGNSVSLMLTCDSEQEINRYYERL